MEIMTLEKCKQDFVILVRELKSLGVAKVYLGAMAQSLLAVPDMRSSDFVNELNSVINGKKKVRPIVQTYVDAGVTSDNKKYDPETGECTNCYDDAVKPAASTGKKIAEPEEDVMDVIDRSTEPKEIKALLIRIAGDNFDQQMMHLGIWYGQYVGENKYEEDTDMKPHDKYNAMIQDILDRVESEKRRIAEAEEYQKQIREAAEAREADRQEILDLV